VTPTCPRCGGPTVALFYSRACASGCHEPRGFVALRGPTTEITEYVFRTREHAERWRSLVPAAWNIREVRASEPFRWQPTPTGLADRMYEVCAEGEPGPGRVVLV
jgi:hypothetical protein